MLVTTILAVLLTMACIVLTRKRSSSRFHVEPDQLSPITTGLPFIAGITNSTLCDHNAVSVFENSAIFDAMIKDIKAAHHSVHLETFIWTPGRVTKPFVDLLCEKVRQGIDIRVLIDALGSMSLRGDDFRRMRACGVELIKYQPVTRFDIRRFNNRVHRKMVVVDGRVGYTFGHGHADQWLGHGQDKRHWRDTGVRLEGDVVRQMQSVFLRDWLDVPDGYRQTRRCFRTRGRAVTSPHMWSRPPRIGCRTSRSCINCRWSAGAYRYNQLR